MVLRVPDIGGVQPVYRNFRRVAHGRCERSAKDARSNRENAVRRTSTIGDKTVDEVDAKSWLEDERIRDARGGYHRHSGRAFDRQGLGCDPAIGILGAGGNFGARYCFSSEGWLSHPTARYPTVELHFH